jgi:hypothetical protein
MLGSSAPVQIRPIRIAPALRTVTARRARLDHTGVSGTFWVPPATPGSFAPLHLSEPDQRYDTSLC